MRCFLISLLLAHAISTIAQEYYFRQMPTDYGRDIQQIKILFQGTDHMVWMGTDQGLYSFDGRKYRHASRPDGVTQSVSTIAESPQGEIWVGYEDGFLQVANVKGYSNSVNADSLKDIRISKILFLKNGDTYIATYGAGMWIMHDGQLSRLRYQGLGDINDIYDALIDKKDRLWIGTDHGIWIYQNSPVESLRNLNRDDGLPDEIVTELEEDYNGDIWIAFYDHGLGKYISTDDTITIVVPTSAEDGIMVSLVNGHHNEVWFGTERTINHYSLHNKDRRIKLPIEIKDRIETMLFDRTGNLWIASGNKLFMANTQIELRMPGLKGIQAITAFRDKLWLGCEKGLFSMDQHSGLVAHHLEKENLNILSIYHDSMGILWIGTFGQGLYIYDPDTKESRHMTEKDQLSNNSILNIDGKGSTVWLATLGGITEINWSSHPIRRKPEVILFGEKFKFPAGYVYDVYVAADGKVWFGTDGKGLYVLDGGQLNSVTKPLMPFGKDSFEMRTIYSITGDEKNNIWVSATKGNILRIDADGNVTYHISSPYGSLNSLNNSGQGEIIMVREGAIQVHHPVTGISFFGSSAGLGSFSPNINSTAKELDGSVWIADSDKVLHYIPFPVDTTGNVHMHLMDVTPGNLQHANVIRLKPDSNFLDFRFTGLWYPDPQSVRYRYMLRGHDKDWIHTQEGRVVYSRLSPGTYTFVVSGSYNDDFSQSLPVEQEIVVLPPFYLTWWFILGSIIIIAFLTMKFMRSRISRLNRFHQLEKEKTTLQLNAIQAQVNPHFLFNSFNTLSGIIEEDQEAAVVYVDQLSSFFRGVLLHRNAELIPLEEEIEIMRNYTYILQKRYGENIRIIEEIETVEGFIAPLSLQLLVENAIKHNIVSQEKPLMIRISGDGQWLIVSNPIRPKFQSMNESTGFGLSSLLARYQYLTTSKIEIINDGNNFTVKIPIIHPNTHA